MHQTEQNTRTSCAGPEGVAAGASFTPASLAGTSDRVWLHTQSRYTLLPNRGALWALREAGRRGAGVNLP